MKKAKFKIGQQVYLFYKNYWTLSSVTSIYYSEIDISYSMAMVDDRIHESYLYSGDIDLCDIINQVEKEKNELLTEAIAIYPKGCKIAGLMSAKIDGKWVDRTLYTICGEFIISNNNDVFAITLEDNYHPVNIRKNGKWVDKI